MQTPQWSCVLKVAKTVSLVWAYTLLKLIATEPSIETGTLSQLIPPSVVFNMSELPYLGEYAVLTKPECSSAKLMSVGLVSNKRSTFFIDRGIVSCSFLQANAKNSKIILVILITYKFN